LVDVSVPADKSKEGNLDAFGLCARNRQGETLSLQQFTVSMKELAEWFWLETSRIVVDELLRVNR